MKNKVLKLSLIWALLLSVSAPTSVNAAGAGFFSGISNTFKSFTGLFSKASVSTGVSTGISACVAKPKSSGWGVLVWTVGISAVVCGSLFFWKKLKQERDKIEKKRDNDLIEAIRHENFEAFKSLVDKNSKNDDFLAKAVEESMADGKIEMIKYATKKSEILDTELFLKADTKMKQKKIKFAFCYRHLGVLKKYLKIGSESFIDFDWRSVLIKYVKEKEIYYCTDNYDNVRFLCEKLGKKTIKSICSGLDDKLNPLAIACNLGKFWFAQCFIENGAEVRNDYLDKVISLPYCCPANLTTYLVYKGLKIDKSKNYNYRTSNCLSSIEADNKKMRESINSFEGNTSVKYLSLHDTKQILNIYDFFESLNGSSYSKQRWLVELLKLNKFRDNKSFITNLYSKIEFDYTFFNDDDLKDLVDFALRNGIPDSKGNSILKAALICGCSKGLAKVIGEYGPFYGEPALCAALALKGEEKKKMQQENEVFGDYSSALDYLEEKKSEDEFRGLANLSLVMNRMKKELTVKDGEGIEKRYSIPGERGEIVANIMSFAGTDFGPELIGKRKREALEIAN